jgi:hypothetical protein
MTVSATIHVTRDDEDVEVCVTGRVEYFGSYDPRERGEHIGDWWVDSPANITLDQRESDRAIEALEDEI